MTRTTVHTTRLAALLPLQSLDPPAAAITGGLVAGAVYMPGRLLWAGAFTASDSLAPLNRIAALLMGPDVLPPEPAGFVVICIGLLIHLALSIVYGRLIGLLTQRQRLARALWRGAAAGLALYGVNYVLLAPWLFPWFTEGAHLGTLVSHLLFGAVAAAVCTLLQRPAPEQAPRG